MMYDMADSDLGTGIRRARERKRWTQAQLANALGVGVRTVGRWERGEAVPRNSIGALEDALAPYFTAGDEADPLEIEIHDLAARLELSKAEEQRLIDRHRANQRRAEPGIAS